MNRALSGDSQSHVIKPRFGVGNTPAREAIDDLLRADMELDAISARMVLLEEYETAYGIFNHNAPDAGPLALVQKHESEQVSEAGPLYNLIRRFHLHGIHERFGVSLLEFLDLPRDITDLLFSIATTSTATEDRGQRNAERHLRGELNKTFRQ